MTNTSGNPNYWDGKKVLVTGGTGFIGSHLVNELTANGAEVMCLARKEPSADSNFSILGLGSKTARVLYDLENPDPAEIERMMREGGIKYVFHLAGQPILSEAEKDPFRTMRTNVLGTTGVLEACRKASKDHGLEGIVICSSINAYGGSNKLPFTETSTLSSDEAELPYETAILAADGVARTYGGSYGLPVSVARLSNVYGPGDLPLRRLVPRSIFNILKNEPITLRSNGDVKRSFVYVEDVVKGMMAMAEHTKKLDFKGEVFNIGSEGPATLKEVVRTLIGVSGVDYNSLNLVPYANDRERADQYFLIDKAIKHLDWRPQYGLREGLEKTFRWYQERLAK